MSSAAAYLVISTGDISSCSGEIYSCVAIFHSNLTYNLAFDQLCFSFNELYGNNLWFVSEIAMCVWIEQSDRYCDYPISTSAITGNASIPIQDTYFGISGNREL